MEFSTAYIDGDHKFEVPLMDWLCVKDVVSKVVTTFLENEPTEERIGEEYTKSKIVDEHLKTILDNLREDDFGKYKM